MEQTEGGLIAVATYHGRFRFVLLLPGYLGEIFQSRFH